MARRRPPRPTLIVVTPASATVADLLNISGACRDAKLIAACDRFLYLEGVVEMEYRQKAPGHMKRITASRDEREDLEALIRTTCAVTHLGRCAKAEIGIMMLGGGTWGEVAKSALRDFQSMVDAA